MTINRNFLRKRVRYKFLQIFLCLISFLFAFTDYICVVSGPEDDLREKSANCEWKGTFYSFDFLTLKCGKNWMTACPLNSKGVLIIEWYFFWTVFPLICFQLLIWLRLDLTSTTTFAAFIYCGSLLIFLVATIGSIFEFVAAFRFIQNNYSIPDAFLLSGTSVSAPSWIIAAIFQMTLAFVTILETYHSFIFCQEHQF